MRTTSGSSEASKKRGAPGPHRSPGARTPITRRRSAPANGPPPEEADKLWRYEHLCFGHRVPSGNSPLSRPSRCATVLVLVAELDGAPALARFAESTWGNPPARDTDCQSGP